MKNHQNRPEKQLRGRKIQYLRGLAASRKQEKRGNPSTQKRKNMKKQRKYKEMGVYCGRLQARERKSIKKRLRTDQKRPEIIKIDPKS